MSTKRKCGSRYGSFISDREARERFFLFTLAVLDALRFHHLFLRHHLFGFFADRSAASDVFPSATMSRSKSQTAMTVGHSTTFVGGAPTACSSKLDVNCHCHAEEEVAERFTSSAAIRTRTTSKTIRKRTGGCRGVAARPAPKSTSPLNTFTP